MNDITALCVRACVRACVRVYMSSYNLESYSLHALSKGFLRSPLTPLRSPLRKLSRGNTRMLFRLCICNRNTCASGHV